MARSTLTWGKLMLLLGLIAAQAAVGTAYADSPPKIRNVVYIADDHGQQGGLVDNLNQVINVNGLPLYTDQFLWSTLYEVTDNQGLYNFQVKGQQLAARVQQMRRSCPQMKIYMVGFGLGTTVILKAAECLPPNTVTRIILLAPSVSPTYDLRPALASSVEGIDSYCSDADIILKCQVMKFGPSDMGKKGVTTAAGIIGFARRVGCTADARLYAKLRQHTPTEYSDYSHGGHCGYLHYGFLQTQIIPLFQTAMISPCPVCYLAANLQAPTAAKRATPPPPVAQRRTTPQPVAKPLPPPAQNTYVPEYIIVPRASQPAPAPQPIPPPQATTRNTPGVEVFPTLPPPSPIR